MIRRLAAIAILLLIVIIALFLTRGKSGPPQARVAWTNTEAVYYFSDVYVNARGPLVEGKDSILQLAADTGEIVDRLSAPDSKMVAAPDGSVLVETGGKLEKVGFPKAELLVNLGPGVERIEELPSGEYVGRPTTDASVLYSSAGAPVWPTRWPDRLLAADKTSNVYGYDFGMGWVYGIDRATGKVVWDDRSETVPQLLDRNVLVLRGSAAKALSPDGKVVWANNLGEKLIEAQVYDKGIYVLSQSQLFHLSRAGRLLWKRKSEGGSLRLVSKKGLVMLQIRRIDMSDAGIRFRNPADRESFDVIALEPNGKELWSWRSESNIDGAALESDAPHSHTGVPANRVYVTTFNTVTALDPPR